MPLMPRKKFTSSFLAGRIVLLPIEFEACLHVLDTRVTTASQIAQFDTLSSVIALAVAHNTPAQTCAFSPTWSSAPLLRVTITLNP
jgi:hypothetical protein